MPGFNDFLASQAPGQMVGGQVAPQAGLLDRVFAGLLGTPSNYGGLLSPEAVRDAQRQQRIAFGAQLLQAGGPQQHRVGFGQALGSAVQAGNQAGFVAQNQQINTALEQQQQQQRQQQLDQQQLVRRPASVEEFEYAKKNGYPGSFQDWVTAGGQTSRPSSVQEWEFYQNLKPDEQRRYLELKRNPNFSVQQLAGVPSGVTPLPGGGIQTTPLSTLPAENAAAQAKAQSTATGTAKGEIEGAIQKKIVSAGNVNATLDLADPLIEAATGSLTGATRDKIAAVFGVAPEGAQAIAGLKVLQAQLVLNMPRLEGPQSDKDRQLYIDAAGQIGDPTVPAPIKRAAVRIVRDIQKRYSGGSVQTPKKVYNPDTGKIETQE